MTHGTVAELETAVWEALCCPEGCLRRDADCWAKPGLHGAKRSVPPIMQIIKRALASRALAPCPDYAAEIRRAAIEEGASWIAGYSAGQIRMAAGEMTVQEMRTVQAVQRWWVSALRHIATQPSALAQQPADGEKTT